MDSGLSRRFSAGCVSFLSLEVMPCSKVCIGGYKEVYCEICNAFDTLSCCKHLLRVSGFAFLTRGHNNFGSSFSLIGFKDIAAALLVLWIAAEPVEVGHRLKNASRTHDPIARPHQVPFARSEIIGDQITNLLGASD